MVNPLFIEVTKEICVINYNKEGKIEEENKLTFDEITE